MQLELDGKVALVTGGSQGIGRATALAFAAEGASVAICARGAEALEETVRQVEDLGSGRILAIQADLCEGDEIPVVIERCVDYFGRLDILVNNAGSARPGAFLEITDEEWKQVRIAPDVHAALVRELVPWLLDARDAARSLSGDRA